MHAHIEEFQGGVIRVFDDDKSFGDEYRYAFPFRREGDHVEIVGVTSRIPSNDECRVMLAAAAERGWSVWARRGQRVREWHLSRIGLIDRRQRNQDG